MLLSLPFPHRGHFLLQGFAVSALQCPRSLQEPCGSPAGTCTRHPRLPGRYRSGMMQEQLSSSSHSAVRIECISGANYVTAVKVLLTRICFLSSAQDVEVEGRCHFAVVNAKTAAPTVCVSQSSVCVTPAVSRVTVLGAACRFPLCQTPPKTCFVICFCLSCWFWVRWIRSLKRWIGLSKNSPVWGQTYQVMKVVQFLLVHLCQKQIKTESKKIFVDFEIASSEVRLNSPLSWFHMN